MDKQKVLRRGYAETREEWWFLLNNSWSPLFGIIGRFLPGKQAAAEKARKAEKAEDLYMILQKAWDAAPDKPWIHELKGWGLLCDLCSDFPEKEE